MLSWKSKETLQTFEAICADLLATFADSVDTFFQIVSCGSFEGFLLRYMRSFRSRV